MLFNLHKGTGFEDKNNNELRKMIQELSFVALKGSHSYIDNLVDFVVTFSLANLSDDYHHPRVMYQNIVELTGFRFSFDQVLAALNRLKNASKILHIEANDEQAQLYRIKPESRKDVWDKYADQMQLEESVIKQWEDELRSRYPDISQNEIDVLKFDLEVFANHLYSQNSIESLSLYFGDDRNIRNLLEKIGTEVLNKLLPKRDEIISNIRGVELPRFFTEKLIDRKKYIVGQLNQFVVLRMMRLSPKSAKLAVKGISGGTLYLDTNFLFRLLGLQGLELQEAAKNLLELSMALHYSHVVSPKTLEEFRIVLSSMKTRDSLGVSQLNKKNFSEMYGSIEQFLDYYSIKIDDRFDSYIRSNEKSLYQEMALIRKSVAGLEFAQESSLEHDAYHRLLILALRQGYEEKSPFEAPFWFLTCDLKLPVYDHYARKYSGGNKVPFCVLSSQWAQLLAPFSEAIKNQSDSNNDTIDHPIFRAFQIPPASLIQELITRLAVANNMPLVAYAQVILSTAFIHTFDEEVNSLSEIFQLEESNVSIPQIIEDELEKLQVFLCHSSKDKPAVRKLYLKLRSEKMVKSLRRKLI